MHSFRPPAPAKAPSSKAKKPLIKFKKVHAKASAPKQPSTRGDTPVRTPSTVSESVAFGYLGAPPYFGDSSFDVKEDVKRLCTGGNGQKSWKTYRYNTDTKQWGTNDLWALRRLLQSGIWTPAVAAGNPAVHGAILAEVNARIDDNQKESSDHAAAESAALREASLPSGSSAQTANQRDVAARKRALESGVLPSTPEEMKQLLPLGFTDALVESSLSLEILTKELRNLGPRTGISPAGRILRMLRLKRLEVRSNNPVLFFDAVALAPLYDASDRSAAAALIAVIRDPVSSETAISAETARKKRSAAEQTALYHPTEREATLPAVKSQRCNPTRATAPKPSTPIRFPLASPCPICKKVPTLQFLDCTCIDAPPWVNCTPCGSLVNKLLRPCGHVHTQQWAKSRGIKS